jgi:hypothetical protein
VAMHGPGMPGPVESDLHRSAVKLLTDVEQQDRHNTAREEYTTKVERELEDERRKAGRLRARVDELEALPDPVLTFGEADDRRGFVLFIDGVQVGEPVTYDDFGWSGIDLARSLVVAVAEAFGGEVTGP